MKFWSKKLNLGNGNWEKQSVKVCGCGLNSAALRYRWWSAVDTTLIIRMLYKAADF